MSQSGIARREFLAGAAGSFGGLSLAAGAASRQTPSPEALLKNMSPDEKIGQLLCGSLSAGNAEELVRQGRVGSLYGLLGNRASAPAAATFLNHLQGLARYPLLFVGEQEQGSGRNFPGGTEFPAYMAFGAARSTELAYLFGKINTLEGRAVGYNWISCPTLDVNIEPANPIINTRSVGERPELVTELGVESCRAIVENRGLTCICHFPGHGATGEDSHVTLPIVRRSRAELLAVELAPYRAGIRAGHMNCIMTAHNSYPGLEPQAGLPATLSRNIMTRLLREELKYDGLLATDGLGMKAVAANFAPGMAAVMAIAAGCDILLTGDLAANFAALRQALEDGRLSMERLDASVRRILEAKRWLGLFQQATVDVAAVDSVVGCRQHRAVARRVAQEAITVLRREGLPVANGRKTAVISSAQWCDLARGLGQADAHVVEAVRKRLPDARVTVLGEKGEGWAEARSAAREAQAVVLALGTKTRSYTPEAQRTNQDLFGLVREIAGLGKHTSLLVLGNPYVVKDLPRTAVCLCSYSNCADSIAAAFEVLFGQFPSKGKLPVTLSQEYRYGFGL
jgi:beta-N-acetylhexosaminidase